MKMAIFIIGLSVALMEQTRAQTNQPASPETATNNLPPDVLVTKTGTVYNQFRVVKSDPAGLIIRYVPDEGGIGMEKVPFEFLPENWQQRYKYDPEKAAQYDLEQKKAIAHWREKMIADEQASREKWARWEAEEEAARQAKRDAEAAKRPPKPRPPWAPTPPPSWAPISPPFKAPTPR